MSADNCWCYIVVIGDNRYLQGIAPISGELLFTPYRYDAYRFNDSFVAWQMAQTVGGIYVEFNPVTNEVR